MASSPSIRFLDRTTPPHITTLILIAGLSALNMSIFLPALDLMAEDFGASYGTMQIAVSGYLAATAVIQIGIGPLSDKFGRRAMSIASIGFFTLMTIGAALAQTAEVFLIFRILQCAVATGIVLSRAVVRDLFPQDQAASMIGYVTMGMALVPMIGPMIGGVLTEAFGWRSTFWVLAISGLAVLLLVQKDMGETVRGGGLSFKEQVASYPALFASPRFWGYALCAAFGSGAFFALLGGASFVANSVFNLSPSVAGFALGMPAIGYAFGNFLSGRYTMRFGINTMALAGVTITSVGMAVSLLISLAGVQSAWLFFGFCVFLGMGNGMMIPNVTAGMLSVRPHLAGTASGLGGALMIGGGAAASQFAGAMLSVETGTLALQWIMLITSVLSVLSILFVIYRTRTIEA